MTQEIDKYHKKNAMLEYDKLKSFKSFVYNDLYKLYEQDKDINPEDLKISIQKYFELNRIRDKEKLLLLDRVHKECSSGYIAVYLMIGLLCAIAILAFSGAGLFYIIPFMDALSGLMAPLFLLGYTLTFTAIGSILMSLGFEAIKHRTFKEETLNIVIESLYDDLKPVNIVRSHEINSRLKNGADSDNYNQKITFSGNSNKRPELFSAKLPSETLTDKTESDKPLKSKKSN